MERAAFLIEETGERIPCLLNPNHVLIRRSAGIHSRLGTAGPLHGADLSDDPVIYSGGGVTEIRLELLFEIGIAGSSIQTQDVRELTGPLWRLAENAANAAPRRRMPAVYFVWGKSWNIPAVVADVAERLEDITMEGVPRRSWMSLRLIRVSEPASAERREAPLAAVAAERTHQVRGAGSSGGTQTAERIDEIAYRTTGDSTNWRPIAEQTGIDNPLHLVGGQVLNIPEKLVRKVVD